MGLESFRPEIWSSLLLTNLRAVHVFAGVCNRNYEGEITTDGQTVKISQIGAITVSTYTPNSTTITPQKVDGAQRELKINQVKYFSFEIDQVINAQSRPKVMLPYMQEAAWSLNDTADQFVAGKYTDAQIIADLGTEATGIEITSVNVTEYIGLVNQKLDEANVPTQGRWMILPPWMKQKIILAKIMLDTNNTSTLESGFVGNYLGINIFVSNNVSTKTSASNQGSRCMAGYQGTITFADQLIKLRAFEPESSLHDAVTGFHIYGSKTVRPDTLAVLRADYTAEP